MLAKVPEPLHTVKFIKEELSFDEFIVHMSQRPHIVLAM